MSSSSTPIPAGLQNLLAPQPAAAPVPSALSLGERIMDTAYRMREMAMNHEALGRRGSTVNRFNPDVDPMSPTLQFKQALDDFKTPSLPPSALGSAGEKTNVQALLKGLMVQTVLDLTKGMDFELVEDNWKLNVELLKGLATDQYNALIDANPSDNNFVTERDATLAALDKMQKTGPGSTFHDGLTALDKAMTSQKNLNLGIVLEKTATKDQRVRPLTLVLDLEKSQEEIEKNVSQSKDQAQKDAWNKMQLEQARQTGDNSLGDICAGVRDPLEEQVTGIYKLASERNDDSKTSIHLTFDKKNNQVTGRPLPLTHPAEAAYLGGADFVSSWDKVFDALAQQGNTIELSGGRGKDISVMMDILLEKHKDRYIELSSQALDALSQLGTVEFNTKIKQMNAHNDALQQTRKELLEVAIKDIQSNVVEKGLDAVADLKANVNEGMIARIDLLEKALDAAIPPSPEQREKLVERLVAEIEKQTKELEGKSDQDLTDPKMVERIDAINNARTKVEGLLVTIRADNGLPPATAATAAAPATVPPVLTPAQVLLDTKLKALSGKCNAVKTKMDTVAEKKVEADNKLSSPGPSSP